MGMCSALDRSPSRTAKLWNRADMQRREAWNRPSSVFDSKPAVGLVRARGLFQGTDACAVDRYRPEIALHQDGA